jgi:hypothetical protein
MPPPHHVPSQRVHFKLSKDDEFVASEGINFAEIAARRANGTTVMAAVHVFASRALNDMPQHRKRCIAACGKGPIT